jgi:membrane protein YqaA with SNARE-associated domain
MEYLKTLFQQAMESILPLAERLGAPGLALIAFLDSSFLSLPQVGDALIVALTIQNPDRWYLYSGATTLGSTAGCLVLYTIARKGGEAFLRRRFSEAQIERGLGVFRRYGLLAVIVPAFLPPPTPFKLFVLLAGLAGVRPVPFTIGIAVGRAFRFGGEGWLAYKYGPQATQYIEDNLATASIIAASVVLVIGLAVIVVRSRAKRRSSNNGAA